MAPDATSACSRLNSLTENLSAASAWRTVCFCLRNLLDTIALAQLPEFYLGLQGLGLGQRQRILVRLGIECRQHRAGSNRVPFVIVHGIEPSRLAKGHFNFANIDVAIQHNRLVVVMLTVKPAISAGDGDN